MTDDKFTIRIESRVHRELGLVSKADRLRIYAVIESLADNPRPRGCRKLVNRPGWRVRIGRYRIIYDIDDNRRIVTILNAAHRKDVYGH